MDSSVWVILPTYDEAENIEAVVGGIRAAAPEAKVLVVDDNSRDGTGAIADRLRRRRQVCTGPASRVSAAPTSRASSARSARGADYVVEMDADLSHDPADLPRLIAPARDGADLVLGSRYVHGGGVENWGPQRRLISLGGCEYARRVLGLRDPRPDRRLQVLSRRDAAADRRADGDRAGLRLPGRADLAHAAARPGRRRGADPLPRAPARRVEDVRADRARGGLARSGPALRPAAVASAEGRPTRRSLGV